MIQHLSEACNSKEDHSDLEIVVSFFTEGYHISLAVGQRFFPSKTCEKLDPYCKRDRDFYDCF